MKSRSVIYLSLIFIGVLLSEALPYFQILGVTPFMFFCALFLPYFGWKTYLLVLGYFSFILIRFLPSFFKFAEDIMNFLIPLLASEFPEVLKSYLPSIALLFFLGENMLICWLTSRALKKIGVYRLQI